MKNTNCVNSTTAGKILLEFILYGCSAPEVYPTSILTCSCNTIWKNINTNI